MAGWGAVLGSALLVATLFESVAALHTVEMRDSIHDFLTTPPGDGLGIGVAQALDLLRGAMLFAGAVAAAAVVLAVYVLQRHKGARIGLTVAAVLLVVTAPVSGGVLPVLVAVATAMLWSRPARDWFAGRAPATTPARRETLQNEPDSPAKAGSSRPERPPPSEQADRPGEQAPPPTYGFGSPTSSGPAATGYPGPPPTGRPDPQRGYPQGYGYPGTSDGPDKRPVTVTIAAVLTWVFAGLTTAAYVVVLVVLLIAKNRFLELVAKNQQFRDANISNNQLIAALWVISAVLIFWCLAAMVLALLAFRRQNWARIVLVVSAAISILLGLVAFPFDVLHLIAAGAVIALLFTGGANRWYSRSATQEKQDPPRNVW